MNIRILLVVLVLFGAAMGLYASFMPAYKDKKAKEALDLLEVSSESDKRDYYEKEEALRTNRNTLLDVGSGIAISSLTILLFLKILRLSNLAQIQHLRTISKLQFFIWLNAGWAILFGALHWYYFYRGMRGDFPPFADSIGIPLVYGEISLMMCWPIINIVFLLVIWPAKLTSYIFEMPHSYTWRAILVETLFSFWLLLIGLYTVIVIVDGDHFTIPVVLLFLYLLVVLRAGHMQAINHKNQ